MANPFVRACGIVNNIIDVLHENFLNFASIFDPNPLDTLHLRRLLHSGTLPGSVRLKGKAYRYQNRDHVHPRETLWKVFEDGPWKWQIKGRFAPAWLNTGHYFALTPAAAKQELSHYVEAHKQPSYSLLTVVMKEIDNVLDLTSWDNANEFMTRHGIDGRTLDLMAELVRDSTAGSKLTDFVGVEARRDGYSGILYFSARVRDSFEQTYFKSITQSWDADQFLWEFEMFERLITNVCVVYFSGSAVLTSIKSFRWNNEPIQENQFFGMSGDEVNRVFEYGPTYQVDMLEQIIDIRHNEPDT